MSLLLALAAPAESLPDMPLAERAAMAALQVCEPFLAGRLTKPTAAEAAVAMGFKRLSRADASPRRRVRAAAG